MRGVEILRIGIPRALLYYYFFPLWKTFYEELDCEVILSSATNKKILDLGVKSCVDEACLPIKVFHGHVESIKDKVDFSFIPRITSFSFGEFTCPKLCGLPEMIIHSITDLPGVISPDFNLHDKRIHLDRTILEMSQPIGAHLKRAKLAYQKAFREQEAYRQQLYEGFLPEETLSRFKKNRWRNDLEKKNKGNILVLSHPYNLFDSFINMGLINKVRKMGYRVHTVEGIKPEIINRYAYQLPKKMFWTFGRELIGSGLYAMDQKFLFNGVIFLSSFACGLDSIIADYIERRIKRESNLPFMQLVIDEHTGEAGIDTRIEAFIEMIERRRDNGSDLSSHGECIYRS